MGCLGIVFISIVNYLFGFFDALETEGSVVDYGWLENGYKLSTVEMLKS